MGFGFWVLIECSGLEEVCIIYTRKHNKKERKKRERKKENIYTYII